MWRTLVQAVRTPIAVVAAVILAPLFALWILWSAVRLPFLLLAAPFLILTALVQNEKSYIREVRGWFDGIISEGRDLCRTYEKLEAISQGS